MQNSNKVEPTGYSQNNIESPPPPYFPSAPPVSPPQTSSVPTQHATSSVFLVSQDFGSSGFYNGSAGNHPRFLLYPSLPPSEYSKPASDESTCTRPSNSSYTHIHRTSRSGDEAASAPPASFTAVEVLPVNIHSAYPLEHVKQPHAFPMVTVTVTQVQLLQMSRERQRVFCPYCNVMITTVTSHSSGMLTHLSAIAAGVLTWCLCCCVPYCLPQLKDVEHHCPRCGRSLGCYRRLGHI